MIDWKHRTFSALKWNFVGTLGTQAIQFVISIILARLLLPSEFGLIAMLSLFMAVAASVSDSGFGSALIQKQNATREDESSVFYFNLGLSVFAFGCIWGTAPWIARFFAEPELVPLARFLALNLMINAAGLVQGALMVKRLDFKLQSKITVITTLVSGSIGATLAFMGYGVWSLAVQSISANLLRVALYWVLNSWRPLAAFSMDSLKSMFPFGSRLLCSGLLNTIFENAYQVIIGKLYFKSDLGFYTRGLTTQRLPVSVITSVLSQVAFPALASIQEDRPRFKSAYRRAIALAGFVTFPIMFGLIAVAQPMFNLLFTPKWAPAAVYFQILCLGGMMMPLHALNLSALMALGRSDLFLRLEIIKKCMAVVAILITFRLGITAMVWGQCITTIASLGVNTFYSGRMIDYPLSQQLRDLLPSFALALAMAIAVYWFSRGLDPGLWLTLVYQAVLGILIYGIASVCFGLSAYCELRRLTQERFASAKQVVFE